MVVLILVFFLTPILYTVTVSIKAKVDLLAFPPKVLFRPDFGYWKEVLSDSDFLYYYKNSIMISSLSVMVVMVVSSLAGYSLSRFDFKRKEDIAFWILSQSMTPVVAIVLPLYILFNRWGMTGKLPGIVFAYSVMNIPFAVWYMRGFFEQVPQELAEAALVDGCGPFKAFLII